MANLLTTTITNLDASPSVVPNVRDSHGRVMGKVETYAVAAADDDADVIRFFRVNAQDRILSIKIFNDAITAGTDYDVGIYAINAGAVVDADCYADGLDLSSASTTGVEARFNDTTTANINLAKQAVWEDAGVATDPGNIQYDLCLTANAIGSSAGDITIQIQYPSGS
jgi:hypothetical protein